MKRFIIFAMALGLPFILLACTNAQVSNVDAGTTAVTDTLPTLDAAQIALGQEIYSANCASCHGVNLEGEANWKAQNEDGSFRSPPHSADGHTWHHPDSNLLEAITLGGARFAGQNIGGTSTMPAFGQLLTDEEITAVLTYIKSTWPDDVRQMQWEVTTASTAQP